MSRVTWVLEKEVYPQSHSLMCNAVLAAQCDLRLWSDDWLIDGLRPHLEGKLVVFHGSLGNASEIRRKFPWTPGAYCSTERFHCSSWYASAGDFLLHHRWRILTMNELVTSPRSVAASLGAGDELFVRPDSPLKPFSGRVVGVNSISFRALDFGFYFDDETTPVVVAPVRSLSREWRFVVVDRTVIAGSPYEASRRMAVPDSPFGESWIFAEQVAREMPSPEAVYIMDICEADGRFHVVELNPFSGADLYGCDRLAVVKAVSKLASEAIE